MDMVRLALQAMATRFELVLYGDDLVALRAAGEEALREIKRLEKQLSFYDPASVISRINREAAKGPVRIPARVFRLLQTTQAYHQLTQGAFDVTVGPLMKCWGFVKGQGEWPEEEALHATRTVTGMSLVSLNDNDFTVSFERSGVLIDLGAIGKGYAIEEAATILRQCGITRALLHGGTSTMVAIGSPPNKPQGWPIGIADARDQKDVVTTITLCDEAFSVSATWGKAFVHNNTTWGHVIDPRSGVPVQGAVLAAVAHPSATFCDALSTGLLILDHRAAEQILCRYHDVRSLVGYNTGDKIEYFCRSIGIDSSNTDS